MRTPILAVATLALLGCTPVISQRGYLPDPAAEASLKVGTDTKTSIEKTLGDPSTSATFGDDAWYYISSVQRQVAFFDPKTTSRKILALHFDKDGKLTDIKHYSLKDGHVVAFETRTTPAKGRELTFLQQLFSATPGVPIGGVTGSAGGQNPGN
ncbi:MAG: outer membrane protein assembly factor BamE [Proteobacteria bacterium]|nr:outer membrane protein assembly factor BamE [Pseudomonadota bacterium]